MVVGWAKRKFVIPIIKIIKQGISIERLAISLALGFIIGIIPLYGVTTFLVSCVALSLRLNFIAMQIAHYIVTPFQLALLIPFYKMGDAVIKSSDTGFTIQQLIHLFKSDFWNALREFWLINLSAVGIWLILSIPLYLLLYYSITYTLRKYGLRFKYLRA